MLRIVSTGVVSLCTGLGIRICVVLACSSAAVATEYRCQPTVKSYCSVEGCTTETEGFQHAELFFYNSEGPALGACLWTNCYAGKASQFVSADGEQLTVIGQLEPDHSPEMYSPMLISLTLDKHLAFTAIWQHSGGGVTLDHGKCETRKP